MKAGTCSPPAGTGPWRHLPVPSARAAGHGAGGVPVPHRVGPSVTSPSCEVLRIDYRDLEENPTWPIRQILDELVQVDDEVYLGQALMQWRGELRRAASFSLEPWHS